MNPKEAKSFLLLFTLGLVWGSSYILIKRGLEVFSPGQVATLRLSLTALFFFPWFLRGFRQMPWARWKPLLAVGVVGNLLPFLLFALAQTRLSSSLTGIISSLTPLFTMIIGLLFFSVRISALRAIGILLGLSGAVWLVLQSGQEINSLSQQALYASFVMLATICYAVSANIAKTYLGDVSAKDTSTASFVFILPFSLIWLWWSGTPELLYKHAEAWTALGYIALLAFFGTVLASLVFYRLVQLSDAVFASSVSYIIPFIALLWGYFDGEHIGMEHFIGMGLILVGLYLGRK